MSSMYGYVGFYHDIYFVYIFDKKVFISSNTCYEFSHLDDTISILFCEKPNCFQYYVVTIHFFCFVIINTKVVQIGFCARKCKNKITVKNSLTKNYNTMVDPVKITFQLNKF